MCYVRLLSRIADITLYGLAIQYGRGQHYCTLETILPAEQSSDTRHKDTRCGSPQKQPIMGQKVLIRASFWQKISTWHGTGRV